METEPAAIRRVDVGDISVYHGNCGAVFGTIEPQSVDILITDPSYHMFAEMTKLAEQRQLNLQIDCEWLVEVNRWLWSWWNPLTNLMSARSEAWIFCDVVYMGFFVRMMALTNWPLRGIVPVGPREFLINCSERQLTETEQRVVRDALTLNVYGHGKNVRMLKTFLQMSPKGRVLDPFMGRGSTLLAAQEAGYPAIGIEWDETYCDAALTALGAA